jgi:MFS family permease
MSGSGSTPTQAKHTRQPGLRARLGVLRSRPFRLLFSAQFISRTGDTFTTVALPFAVLRLTGSVADVGVVLAARTLPLAVLVMFGGVWADRVPRRSVLVVGSNTVRFVSQAGLAVLLIADVARLSELVVLMAVYGVAAALFYPAMSGLVPQTVAESDLQSANALLSFTRSSSTIFGPTLAGLLVGVADPGWAIAIDSLSFAVSAYLFLIMRLPNVTKRAEGDSILAQFRDGWTEVHSRPWVLATIIGFSIFAFAGQGSLFVLGPSIAQRFLGGARVWGLLLTAAGAGAIIGDLLGLRLRPERLIVGTVIGLMLCCPALICVATVAPTVCIGMAFTAFGAATSFADTMWYTALQEHVPKEALSRVSAYDWMGSTVFQPLGQGLAGPLALVVGTASVLNGAAVLIFATSLVIVLMPSVRQLRRLPSTS